MPEHHERMAAAGFNVEDGLVFVTRNGRLVCRNDVYRARTGALAKVGIGYLACR